MWAARANWDDMMWDVVNIETGEVYTGGRTEDEARAIAERLNNKVKENYIMTIKTTSEEKWSIVLSLMFGVALGLPFLIAGWL